MNKLLISAVFIIGFVGYALLHSRSGSSAIAFTPQEANIASIPSTQIAGTASTSHESSTAVSPASSIPSGSSGAVVPATTAPSGKYKDGTYTGTAADAYYGMVQVAAVISGGKLTNVTTLDYPNDRRESVSINQRALPALISEAIQAQGAKVSGVSGASDTSAAFKESLSSALSQAVA